MPEQVISKPRSSRKRVVRRKRTLGDMLLECTQRIERAQAAHLTAMNELSKRCRLVAPPLLDPRSEEIAGSTITSSTSQEEEGLTTRNLTGHERLPLGADVPSSLSDFRLAPHLERPALDQSISAHQSPSTESFEDVAHRFLQTCANLPPSSRYAAARQFLVLSIRKCLSYRYLQDPSHSTSDQKMQRHEPTTVKFPAGRHGAPSAP